MPSTRPERIRLGLIFAIASLIFGACGGGGAASTVAPGGESSQAAPSVVAPGGTANITPAPASGATGDLCNVMTTDEAAMILGAPLRDTPKGGSGSCYYTAAESPAGNYHSMTVKLETLGADAASAASAFKTMELGGVNAQTIAKDIPGVGDGAFGSATSGKIGDTVVPVEVHISAYKGTVLLQIDVGPTTGIDPQGTLDAVITVTKAAFSRM
jgi:hypothetical protein